MKLADFAKGINIKTGKPARGSRHALKGDDTGSVAEMMLSTTGALPVEERSFVGFDGSKFRSALATLPHKVGEIIWIEDQDDSGTKFARVALILSADVERKEPDGGWRPAYRVVARPAHGP